MKNRAHINHSIKQRLLKYNFFVVFIPTIITVIFLCIFFLSLMFMAYNDGTQATASNARDLVTLFYCQYNVRAIENNINERLNNDALDNNKLGKRAFKVIKKMENLGLHVCVVHESVDLYITPGYDREHFINVGKVIVGTTEAEPQSIVYVDDAHTVVGDILFLDDGTYVSVMFENEGRIDTLFPTLLRFLTTISSNEFLLAILILILLTSLCVIFTIRKTSDSILAPLDDLTKAAKRIREGNLDEPIVYSGINEISRFYEDFEDMRIQLKAAADKQKSIDEMRNLTYGGLIHDAKTAITSIKGYTQGLIDNVADTPQKRERYEQAIFDSSCALERLTNAISDISELDSDTLRFKFEKVDMYDYLSDWFEESRGKLYVRVPDVEFKFENHATEREYCRIDRFQFERVLANIVNNSVKYRRTDVKSYILITADVDNLSSTYIIRISDNGKGIKAEESNKIFDRFYRGDAARSDVRSGNGVGLSVGYQVVQRHNGHISAHGELGKGLTIEITLPVIDVGEEIQTLKGGR